MKGRYVGYKRRPFEQFEAFQVATDDLMVLNEDDVDTALLYADALTSTDEVTASAAMFAYRLLRSASQCGSSHAVEKYNWFLDRLRSNGFWLEVAFSKPGHSSQSESTFFAPYPYHSPSLEERREDAQMRMLLDRERSSARLRRTLEKVHDHPSLPYELSDNVLIEPKGQPLSREQLRDKSPLTPILFDHDNTLFEGIAEASFEASENAHSHALPTDLNVHADDADGGNFFGDAQYLQIGHVTYQTRDFDRARAIHPAFQDYLSKRLSKMRLRKQKLLLFSRADNGPGISRHLQRYGNMKDHSKPRLPKIIGERLTSRTDPGAGHGIQTMIEVTDEINGCLIIQSGGEYFCFDGNYGANDEAGARFGESVGTRGTIVFLAVPVQR